MEVPKGMQMVLEPLRNLMIQEEWWWMPTEMYMWHIKATIKLGKSPSSEIVSDQYA